MSRYIVIMTGAKVEMAKRTWNMDRTRLGMPVGLRGVMTLLLTSH
ncbi:MAG: hypothetical protein NTX17_07575 [Candidatus Eisenbacteria bacterium]|nr:hypothetical protein [Candidatus Eisenbacteria bacterium]